MICSPSWGRLLALSTDHPGSSATKQTNVRLREYVQDRLSGQVRRRNGTAMSGPATASWKGRNKPHRGDRRWVTAWSPEQIANRLLVDFPEDESMRISHAASTRRLRREPRSAQARAGRLLAHRAGAGELRPTTARSYRMHLDGYLVPHLGRLPLGDLRVHHVDAMLDAVRKANATSARPVGPATQRRIVATLRSALADAVQNRLLSWNPASHAKIGKATRPKVDPWSTTEVGAFLDAVAGERDGALWHLAVFSGLRRGELCGLRWSDVELDATRIVVREQATQVGHSVVYGPPKTASGERVVDLDDVTVAVLRAHRAGQAAERLAWGPAYVDSGRVFTRENGEALHPETVTRRFARLVAAAGLRRVRLHDLRHGFASLALAAGVPLAVISKRLGHSSIAITSDTYSHLLEGMGKAAAEQMAGLVRRPMPALRAVSDPAWPAPAVVTRV